MWMFGGTSRDQSVKIHFILTNVIYSIFSLLMHAMIATYFLGSLWYLISTEVNSSGDRFYEDDRFEEKSPVQLCVTMSYYALTTMSTVGYGDFFPLTKVEKLIGVVVMLLGVAFFSNVTTRIIDIVQSKFG